jgi:polyisoprenoid-binding protein YceI
MSKRDEHLRSADYLEVAKFPDISVLVAGAEVTDDDIVDLRAQLTVKGTTTALPLHTKVTALDDGAVRLSTHATVDRKDFGVNGT